MSFGHTRPYEELFFNTCTACVDCFDYVNKVGEKKKLSVVQVHRGYLARPSVPFYSYLSIR
jgi:hypothetical protein